MNQDIFDLNSDSNKNSDGDIKDLSKLANFANNQENYQSKEEQLEPDLNQINHQSTSQEEEQTKNLTEDQNDNQTETATLFPTELADRIEARILEEEMQSSYLTYAMSVIVSRALPDVRDGLKPVHRRILYTMYKLGLTPGAKYVKSARVVGDVLGKYHPHGDASIYNALARMAQDFSLRYPLIDGQGNFGSVDGDSPAAMRYTECRMDKPSTFLLEDIEKETVDYADNYDGTQKEPRVLPTLFPNLLVNGTTGIAVGMATEIPPHNLGEVCEAILYLINNPEATAEDLMRFIQGPDLPTGGVIYGQKGILQAYQTGRGKCVLRCRAELSDTQIIIKDVPYQTNKTEMLKKTADLVRDKKLEGIRDIRDESSNKEGVRIVFELKREANSEVVLNQLYQQTELQTSIHFNLLALINDGRQPKLLNLVQILKEFIAHRYQVVTRRTNFDLKKTREELHILDGLKIALDAIDEVIKLIRASYDKEEASQKLQSSFDLSQRQAEAILQMRLQTLTNLDKTKIENEREQKIALIAKLEEILNNPEVMKKIVCDEVKDVAEKLKSPRKTEIVKHDVGDYNKEDFVDNAPVLVQITQSQYIKVVLADSFKEQNRGGRGVVSYNAKDEDYVVSSLYCNQHDYIYAFTNTGRVFRTRVFDLPQGQRTGRGSALVNYLNLQNGETVTNILALSKEEEENKTGGIIFATKKGLVKLTELSQFNNIRQNGIIAIGLNEGDEVIGACLSMCADDKIVLSASSGKTVIFERQLLSSLGRTAKGVKGIKIGKDQQVVGLELSRFAFASEIETATENNDDEGKKVEKSYPTLLVITENGYGKQTPLSYFRQTNRAASGVKTLNMNSKTGIPVMVKILYGNEESLIITSKGGITIKMNLDCINHLGRNTQGVRVIRLEKGDKVASAVVSQNPATIIQENLLT